LLRRARCSAAGLLHTESTCSQASGSVGSCAWPAILSWSSSCDTRGRATGICGPRAPTSSMRAQGSYRSSWSWFSDQRDRSRKVLRCGHTLCTGYQGTPGSVGDFEFVIACVPLYEALIHQVWSRSFPSIRVGLICS
jgi:hypothetical protein